MAINHKKLMLSILQEVSEGNPIPPATTYDADTQQYANLVEAMQDDGLVAGVRVIRGGPKNKVLSLILDRARITVKGIEYLHENSTLMKTYKGLKELREWLPF